jgi:3-oxoadipate enol-lactonase
MAQSRLDLGGYAVSYERAGAGPPTIVLIHGGLIDSRVWNAQFPWFVALADVIRIDLPGDGSSEPPPGNKFSGVDVLGAVLDRFAIEQASIIGLSGGARIAIDFAIQQPARVDRLVATSPGLSGYDKWALPDERVAAGSLALRRGDRDGAIREWLGIWAPVTGGALFARARENAESLFANTELIDLSPPAIGRLRELEAPTLVIVGDKDQPDILAISAIIRNDAPNATCTYISGADHFPNVFAPDEFNRIAADFVLPGRKRTQGASGHDRP